jgi:hypothetical protein
MIFPLFLPKGLMKWVAPPLFYSGFNYGANVRFLNDLVVLPINLVGGPFQIIAIPILDEVASLNALNIWANRHNRSLVEGFFVVNVDYVGDMPHLGAYHHPVK